MEKLERLCAELGYSFILFFNNHKRHGLSPSDFISQFYPDGFTDDTGKEWVDLFEQKDTIISIEVHDNKKDPLFINFDVSLDNCVCDVIWSINNGVKLKPGDATIDVSLPPKINSQ